MRTRSAFRNETTADDTICHRWHGACSGLITGIQEPTAMNNIATSSFNPLFLRHDLMIELGRLEMAIDDARMHAAANDTVGQLETRCARINEALSKLPA
ncbi:MAG: hypothetical protein ABI843_09975 [Dokdonella sp.]